MVLPSVIWDWLDVLVITGIIAILPTSILVIMARKILLTDTVSAFSPAFSLAWNIAEEKFVKKHLKWMNMFKLRYSYGKVGNDKMDVRFPYLYTIKDDGSGWTWVIMVLQTMYIRE